MDNSKMTQDELHTWHTFIQEHPGIAAKALLQVEQSIARRGRSAFSTFCNAMWMSMTVLVCIYAFTSMFGFPVAVFIGSAVCVVADKALTGLAVLIADKTLQTLRKKEEQNDRDSSSSNR